MVATRPNVKMVTGKINGQDITVPAGTFILEAARQSGIEIPNLCYQPLLRPWGSCRICTVQVLGKRGGLIESCTTPLADGMEVLTHAPEVVQARQFILQMYLIDHALDCPVCDASGQCYLQDNTYLHNINANPYRRPKLAHAYEHFSDTIDYKWDRCIMCNRCTRVCDEVIGVIAIESANRSLEATITPSYGVDLSDTSCTNCGMCIAVCPVGALTDRHFGHHPWEMDTTETVCGHCDVGCTLNVETNKGIVRRVSHLWDRGVNHGYTCEQGKWGYEQIQDPSRLFYPRVRDGAGNLDDATWDDAIDAAVEGLAHHQGDRFAALASPEATNEEAYLLQQFARAVMGTNNVDRHLTPHQAATERAVRLSLGQDVSNTNNMQELFTDAKAALVVGPDIGKAEPIASYWLYHARLYREMKVVVVSQDEYPLARRGDLWLRPAPGTTPTLLNGIARQVVELGLASAGAADLDGFDIWRRALDGADLERVASETGVPAADIRRAAEIYGTGGLGLAAGEPDGGWGPALIYQTAARQGAPSRAGGSYGAGGIGDDAGDPAAIATACTNLAVLTGNLGRAGGGVATFRGSANYQGTTDMGAHPAFYPGGGDVLNAELRKVFEAAWLPRWAERATTSNGFVPVRSLPDRRGLSSTELAAAIERGDVTAMFIEGTSVGREAPIDPVLLAALPKLRFLVVADHYDSPLARLAHVVLPLAMYLEKDGTFTSFDRTVQRVRASIPAMGEAKPGTEIVQLLAARFGYGLDRRHPAQVMGEIARLVPGYAGVSYARLERNGVNAPAVSLGGIGTPILGTGDEVPAAYKLYPRLVPIAAGA